jgi:hypothetical protein
MRNMLTLEWKSQSIFPDCIRSLILHIIIITSYSISLRTSNFSVMLNFKQHFTENSCLGWGSIFFLLVGISNLLIFRLWSFQALGSERVTYRVIPILNWWPKPNTHTVGPAPLGYSPVKKTNKWPILVQFKQNALRYIPERTVKVTTVRNISHTPKLLCGCVINRLRRVRYVIINNRQGSTFRQSYAGGIPTNRVLQPPQRSATELVCLLN